MIRNSAGTTAPFRNGTCLTSVECANQGGTASGTCASGFGVCCIFAVSTSGSSITQSCSDIQNPGFPTALTATNALSYTVNKCTCEVCYFRLDFETFSTMGTGDTEETNGGDCTDQFTITTNTGQAIPTICGENAGQHVYVDVGNNCGDTATLNFAFGAATTSTTFDIKVSQITCNGQFE